MTDNAEFQTRSRALGGIGRWWSRLMRTQHGPYWVIGALSVMILAGISALVAAGSGASSGAGGSRLGPLDAVGEDSGDGVRLHGDPLPALIERAYEMSSNIAATVPEVVEWHERIPWGLPVSLERGWVSSEFSLKRVHPVTGKVRPHYGIDLAVDQGEVVTARARGVVVFSGWKNGYGQVVYIDHENGMSTRYAHLSKLLVKQGNHVRRGDRIGLSGKTGRVTGEHLHYEVRVNSDAVNPRAFLPKNLPTKRPPGM